MCTTTGVGSLSEAVDTLSSIDLSGLPDAEVRGLLLATWRQACRVQAELTRLVGAFDARQAGHVDAARTTAAWLRAFCRMTGPQAAALVRAARATAVLPALAGAYGQGAVGPGHVDRVAELVRRVGPQRVVQVEPVLVTAARTLDPARLGVVCDRVRAHADPDGASPEVDFQRRGLSLAAVDGMVWVKGQLDAEGGATVATALDAWMTPAGEGDERTPAQRRADALVELARHLLHGGPGLPAVAGQRPHLGVLVTAETLAAATDTPPRTALPGHPLANNPLAAGPLTAGPLTAGPLTGGPLTGNPAANHPLAGSSSAGSAPSGARPAVDADLVLAPEPGWTPWAGALSGPTLRRLACDSIVWRVVLDPTNGLPLDLGRQHRTVPGWLRRALIARDHGCRFPGCAAPADWCDGHHLRSWLNGGQTTVTNLILLCRYHHVRIHEHGWSIHLDPATGHVSATRPNGRPYEIRRSPPHTSAWQYPDNDIGHHTAA